MIRDLVRRFAAGSGAAGERADSRTLQAEIDRLRDQNDRMRQAMRHCIDCEYRIDVIERRSKEGRTASGDDA